MVFIVARDSPKTLKSTSLQLIVSNFSDLKSSSHDIFLKLSLRSHIKDSLKKPCSIPK